MKGAAPSALRVHGDQFVGTGMLDFAVNVWRGPREERLQGALVEALKDSSYPDESRARRAIAERHGRPLEEVLPLNGACEGFWLLAQALPGAHAACVHPSFTEAEAALRSTARKLTRVMRRRDDWRVDPDRVPEDADLVVLVNPNNPTGNLEGLERIEQLAAPGRTLVVDESFIDFLPGEESTMADRHQVPGLVVLRSLTKIWGLAGVRAGYLLGPPELIARMEEHRQPWSVSGPALAAIEVCVSDRGGVERIAAEVARARADLASRLGSLRDVRFWPARANFMLIEVPHGQDLVARLAAEGIAVRPCDSFPGLGPEHIRLAVRTPGEHAVLAGALARALAMERQR